MGATWKGKDQLITLDIDTETTDEMGATGKVNKQCTVSFVPPLQPLYVCTSCV